MFRFVLALVAVLALAASASNAEARGGCVGGFCGPVGVRSFGVRSNTVFVQNGAFVQSAPVVVAGGGGSFFQQTNRGLFGRVRSQTTIQGF